MSGLNDLKTLFRQSSFSAGLNCQFDPTKSVPECFPLLLEGRSRRNVIAPTNKHELLDAPAGNYQSLAAFGEFLLLLVDGVAYYADINASPIIFHHVSSWTPMSTTAARIYCELVPTTSNLFNRTGSPDDTAKVFNNSLALFNEAVFCFDGVNPPQAVLPSGSATALGLYSTWTQDKPLYVPIGVLPAFAGNKLYVVSPDFKKVLQSVSGRASDFVVNIDSAGDKGGDADTVSQTVSFNSITALRGLSTGEVLVGSLYGTSVLQLDYNHPQFGEPYLNPVALFPAGPVNELSIIDVLQDTAFITQSGIHSFNAVMQAKRESNNFTFGSRIRSLITNPDTEKSIVQANTCCGLYDDYAFFGMNTIYGYGAIVFDTTTQNFQSLDLSFGHVKQFANTKISGNERLFFITHDNKIYEAFAGAEKHTARILLGEWTPKEAPTQSLCYMVDAVFTNVKGSGQVKFSFYADRVLRDSAILEVVNDEIVNTLPIPIPFVEGKQVARVGFHFAGHYAAWKCAVMIEWNFKGELNTVSVDGKVETGDNVGLIAGVVATTERLGFIANSGYPAELNPGGSFSMDGCELVAVTKGQRYVYDAGSNGILLNGTEKITLGIFTAVGTTVAIQGSGVKTYSLRNAENYLKVIESVREFNPTALLHGGNFAPFYGSAVDVALARLPINMRLLATPGEKDIITTAGSNFFNKLGLARYYHVDFEHISVFFFNSNASEPDGITTSTKQAGVLRNWLESSTKPFKIIVTHFVPTSGNGLLYLLALPGVSAMLCGETYNMQRFDVGGIPLFVCGSGGFGLVPVTDTTAVFSDDTHYGSLQITADALSCKINFVDTDGNALNSFSLYS